MFFFYQRQLVMAAIAQMARIAAEESCSAPCLNAGELVSPEETQQVFFCVLFMFSPTTYQGMVQLTLNILNQCNASAIA
jgi:hypothetical protein